MSEAPHSNRPTPRTTAAVEAELRRQIRIEMAQAREDADGELDDASLASIIARAIGIALGWHLESPEHTRNATASSRTWRPASGPRGGRSQEFEDRPADDRGPRPFDDRRRPGPLPPRAFTDRGPRDFNQNQNQNQDDRNAPPRRGPRDDDRERDFPPRRGPQGRPPFQPRGGGRPPNRSSGGGFGPRRPPPPRGR